MHFKDIYYLELWRPFCSAKWNQLCNFGRRHHEEQFCENYFEFGPVVQEKMSFKDISYLELWASPFIQRSTTICAILVEGIMRNNSVKLF